MGKLNIGITGGKGMLGSDIKALAEQEGFNVLVYDLPEFDITRQLDIDRLFSECDLIVNCAAYTAVDKAESNLDIAKAVNSTSVANLAEAAKRVDKYILHISTDFVFGDNGNSPLVETSLVKPLSVYGATKLEGEIVLQKSGCRHSIIRIEWTYGTNGENFITKIANIAVELDKMKVVSDQVGSPTSTEDVARAVLYFIKHQVEGLYHFAAKGYATRYEVAKFILDELGIETSLSQCSSDEFQAPAKRPKNSRFDCSKIDKILDFERSEWHEMLRTFLLKENVSE